MSFEPEHFDTDKRKLDRIRNAQIKQKVNAERQQARNKLIDERLEIVKPLSSVIKRFRDIGTNWEQMEVATFFSQNPEDADPDTQYKNWEIVIPRLDERLIPFIKAEILLRSGEGFDDGKVIPAPSKNIVFMVEDLPESNIVKKVTILASIYFGQVGGFSDIEHNYFAKLVVSIANPQKDI